MNTLGIVAGSFDPITRGHEWLVSEAARLVDALHVVIGANPAKKYVFSDEEREAMVRAALADLDLAGTPVTVHFLHEGLLVHYAAKVGATHLIRGIRNLHDFAYETDMALVNRKLEPGVRTVYLHTPPELLQVSASTVRTLVGHPGWQSHLRDYVHPAVIAAFERRGLPR